MTLVYQSTRDTNNKVTASQAILQGLATDGGLFTPISLPEVNLDFDQLKDASYQEVAKIVLSAFLDDFTEEELDYCITNAYDSKFDIPAIGRFDWSIQFGAFPRVNHRFQRYGSINLAIFDDNLS